MLHYFNAFLLIGLLSVMAMSCNDILEVDISEDQVEIILPTDGSQLSNTVVSFWWEPVEDATNYKIVFVEGTFAQPLRRVGEVIIDAAQTTYDSTFVSGDFSWSIIAFNTGYSTDETISTFSVGDSAAEDISMSNLQLSQPVSDASLMITTVDFSWAALSGADNYFLQIAQPDFSDLNNILQSQTTSQTTLQFENFSEGTYAWRVRGENTTSVSPYTTRSFTIDLTAPDAPILTAPLAGAVLELPIQLAWQSPAESFEIEVNLDSTFTAVGFNYISATNNFNFEDGNSGDVFYWKVLAIDPAGNKSVYSDISRFSVQ